MDMRSGGSLVERMAALQANNRNDKDGNAGTPRPGSVSSLSTTKVRPLFSLFIYILMLILRLIRNLVT